MGGFRFRYRLNGSPPTLERLALSKAEALSEGDLLQLEAGEVALAVTGDGNLLGAAQARSDGTAFIEVITDADAVYAVTDPDSRLAEDSLDLTGTTGSQGVNKGPNRDFAVVVGSSDTEETLVRVSVGRHAYDRLSGGELNAALSQTAGWLHKRYIGRGPMKTRAFFHDDVIVVLMHSVMTTAERTLAASGQHAAVADVRRQLQQAMRQDLVVWIERWTGFKVVALMSDSHIDPDMAVEVFVLDRPVPPGPNGLTR
jgi:uncharacterized protein YbcI